MAEAGLDLSFRVTLGGFSCEAHAIQTCTALFRMNSTKGVMLGLISGSTRIGKSDAMYQGSVAHFL